MEVAGLDRVGDHRAPPETMRREATNRAAATAAQSVVENKEMHRRQMGASKRPLLLVRRRGQRGGSGGLEAGRPSRAGCGQQGGVRQGAIRPRKSLRADTSPRVAPRGNPLGVSNMAPPARGGHIPAVASYVSKIQSPV